MCSDRFIPARDSNTKTIFDYQNTNRAIEQEYQPLTEQEQNFKIYDKLMESELLNIKQSNSQKKTPYKSQQKLLKDRSENIKPFNLLQNYLSESESQDSCCD